MNVEATGERIERLLDEIAERDEIAAELTEDLLRELMALYGAGLARILDRLRAVDADAPRAMAGDPLVGGLLLLHDLHPLDASARVAAALDELRPDVISHGCGVQLLGVTDGVAQLRLNRGGGGCGTATLRQMVEDAVLQAAPDVRGVDVEEVPAPAATALIPAETLSLRRRDGQGAGPHAGEILR